MKELTWHELHELLRKLDDCKDVEDIKKFIKDLLWKAYQPMPF